MRNFVLPYAAAVIPAVCLCAAASGAVVPFTEDFTGGAAGWRDASGAQLADWVPAGGPDGSAYVTASYLVPDPLPPFGAILFRAQDEFGSSGGAFEGDWISDGVSEFSFFIRHDGPAPLDVFARFAGPLNFPGAVGISFVPVQPGAWTEITIPIAPGSPNIILEGAAFEDVFGDIGHLQIGILPSELFVGASLTVDLDKVSIVPAPGTLAVLALAGVARRRRRTGGA